MSSKVPSPDELQELLRLFFYDAVAGCVCSRTTGAPVKKNNGRYVQLRFSGRTVVAHCAVWFFHFGTWPSFEIDHRDGDTFNNHHLNLRPADRSTNMQNIRGPKASNRLGVLGVTRHRRLFRAAITLNGKRTELGLHSTPETAHEAYLRAKRSLHPYGQL